MDWRRSTAKFGATILWSTLCSCNPDRLRSLSEFTGTDVQPDDEAERHDRNRVVQQGHWGRSRELCRQFRLPTLAEETVSRFSEAGHEAALPTLVEVLEQEAEDRRIRRVDRLRRASKLPAGKTWDTFEHERAPVKLRQQLASLAEGNFADRGVNVLAFGLPGTGKTHAMCAIGHRLVQSGRSVLFIPAYRLVQDMLAAKRDLELPRMLRKLDNFDLLIIDDLGYLPQGAEESEVLFTLIADQSGRRSSPTRWRQPRR